MATGSRPRAAKPPFYRNVFVRHPVNPFLPLSRAERGRLRALEPLVVMGRGHSGTRVLAWICFHLGYDMGSDPVANPSGDPSDRSFRHHQRVVATHSLDVRSVADTRYLDRNRFQRAVRGFHRRLRHDQRCWGWKFPECYLIGPYVEATFPAARYLHLLRDGRDVAFKRHLTDVAEHRLARAILRRRGVLDAPHHLQAACSWALQVEHFEAFRRTIASERVLTLRYEDLVRRPHEAVERIAAFLGVAVTPACRAYVDGTITAAHAGQHRREDPALVREVEARIGATLAAFGYAAPGSA
jgi:hypothetical protein